MSVSTMEELLIDELKDIYNAEKQITRALPKMAKATTSQELRQAFESHLEETEGQIQRLEQAFEILGKSARGKTCHGMQGVLEEGSEVIEDTKKSPLRDAALISAAQRVEHYEMAAYGCVREYARLLGQDQVVQLLEQTLEEEKAADEKLNSLSESVNSEAMSASQAA
jgi:ferritin-like metal-binding protein YciE